jgi:hypothetical protein
VKSDEDDKKSRGMANPLPVDKAPRAYQNNLVSPWIGQGYRKTGLYDYVSAVEVLARLYDLELVLYEPATFCVLACTFL